MTDDVPGMTPAPVGDADGPQEWAVPQSWVIPPDWALPDVHNPGARVEPEPVEPEPVEPEPVEPEPVEPEPVEPEPTQQGYDTGSDSWLRAQPADEPAASTPAAVEPVAVEPGAVAEAIGLAEAPDPARVALVSRSERRQLLAAQPAPVRSPVRAILGAVVAVAGVAVVLLALLAVRSGPGADSPTVVSPVGNQATADPAQLLAVRVPTPAVSAAPQTGAASADPGAANPASSGPVAAGLAPTTPPSSAPSDPDPAAEAVTSKGQLTVLNDSRIKGLADRAAAEFRAGNWSVPTVGNYTGQVPATTVYYGPDEQQAARRLVAQFPGIVRVLPRFDGLPGSGLTVVVTREYQA